MSTQKQNPGCVKIVLTIVGIGLAFILLKFLYFASCYLAVNLFVGMDSSVYGQMGTSSWVGYALLGLGLGTAGGAIAAQRRFRLNSLVSVGAVVLILALCSFVFIDNTANSALVADTQPVDNHYAIARAGESTIDTSTVITPVAESTHQDTASEPAEEWMRVVVRTAPLHSNWVDSLAAPHAHLKEADTVHVIRRAHGWARVVVGGRAGQDGAPVGWIRLTGLGPFLEPESGPEEPPEQVATASFKREPRVNSNRDSATATTHSDTEPAAAPVAWPTGHRQHTGQIGKFAATYSIDWQPNGVLTGSYYNDQNPGAIYRLTGVANAAGELHLVEFTRGRQSARCELKLKDGTYTGTMFNTDGHQFPMSLE